MIRNSHQCYTHGKYYGALLFSKDLVHFAVILEILVVCAFMHERADIGAYSHRSNNHCSSIVEGYEARRSTTEHRLRLDRVVKPIEDGLSISLTLRPLSSQYQQYRVDLSISKTE